MTDARFAVVMFELFGGHDHTAVGNAVLRVSIGFIEHIDHKLTIDFDRLIR